MSQRSKALAVRPASYSVGYAKAPVQTRFKPGQSGNPQSRPTGSRNTALTRPDPDDRLQSIILDEAYRGVPVNDGNGQVTIPMAQASCGRPP